MNNQNKRPLQTLNSRYWKKYRQIFRQQIGMKVESLTDNKEQGRNGVENVCPKLIRRFLRKEKVGFIFLSSPEHACTQRIACCERIPLVKNETKTGTCFQLPHRQLIKDPVNQVANGPKNAKKVIHPTKLCQKSCTRKCGTIQRQKPKYNVKRRIAKGSYEEPNGSLELKMLETDSLPKGDHFSHQK